MSFNEQEWQVEQQRVSMVDSIIDKRTNQLQQEADIKKEDVVQIRKHFWDDVTVNLENAAEAAETYASMKQQAEVLSERERGFRHAVKQLRALHKLKVSPYFGRIDFKEDGQEKEEIYIGIASLLDDSGEAFLVYDWRAPVSSMYYDYSPGPAQYKTPNGTFSGEMILKRQYIIRNAEIKSMFDTGITIGDELLQQVLGKQSDSQMKSIVATIQKEQNQIIRNEHSKLLVVQGAAGSGKTSAALQRVAYLLYRYRETVQADNIVLFSPNPMFNSYVSTVLPELGEENMQQTTFQDYLALRLGNHFSVEDPFEQLEYVLTEKESPEYEARLQAISFKSSELFMAILERYVSLLGQQGIPFHPIMLENDVLISSEEISEHFYSLDPSYSVPNRMELLSQWLLKELSRLAKLEKEKPWVEEAIQLLDKADYLSAFRELRRKKKFDDDSFDDYDSEEGFLATKVVQRKFKGIRSYVKRLGFLDMVTTYRELFSDAHFMRQLETNASLPLCWEDICAMTRENIDQGILRYEDATPYLFLLELLQGFQTNNAIRHLFIDEAQDYSPFQFSFMKRLFPRSKITALGDFNQAIYTHTESNASFDHLLSLFKPEDSETFVLTRSYRSTKQIIEFTRGIVRGGENIEPFNRQGNKPIITRSPDHADLPRIVAKAIERIQLLGHRSIAVICKSAKESSEAYEALKTLMPVKLIRKESSTFEDGVVIIPSYLAKGVEFDGVIIYNASEEQYRHERERKLFYTACTRAMHELYLCYVGEMSPFITPLSSETYQKVDV